MKSDCVTFNNRLCDDLGLSRAQSILGQVCCFIVSIPDLCLLSYYYDEHFCEFFFFFQIRICGLGEYGQRFKVYTQL